MRNTYMKLLLIPVCCFALLLGGCSLSSNTPSGKAAKVLNANRPAVATELPDFSGEITDVRVTTVQRDAGITTHYGAEYGADLSTLTYLQIYYGYCSNGVWKDIPCENYALVSIFNPVDYHSRELVVTRGYEAVEDDHIVKIGPYLLISIDARIGTGKLITVEDSIGSEAQLMFMEYDRWNTPDGTAKYGYLKENRESVLSGGKLEWQAVSNVDARYYIVLKYDEIPDDYQLWTKMTPDSENIRSLLTYTDIQSLLGE